MASHAQANGASGRRPSREMLRGLLWISPWIVGFALFMAAPIWLSLYYSLTDYSLLEPAVFIGLENYRELMGDHLFWITARNTLVYAAFSVALGTMITIAVALALNSAARGVTVVRAIVFLPTIVPLVAAALGWLWMYNAELGPINTTLETLGVRGPDWLGDKQWALRSLVLMSVWQVGGAVVICLAALQDVPKSLYEAADIDGMTALRRFTHVTLPMISPAVLFNVVMAIIWSLQIFAVPFIMTEGGPDNATNFYTMYLYENAFVNGRMGYASAMAWLQLLVTLLLTGMTLLISKRLVYYRAA